MLRGRLPSMRENAMSEQNQQEPDRSDRPTNRPSSRSGGRARTARDPEAVRALSRLDEAQETAHLVDRIAPARRETFPKDDRRSSALLTERERSERWPLG